MSLDSPGFIGVPEVVPRTRWRTGGQKRRDANALPRVFLVVGDAAYTILGVILMSSLYQVGVGEPAVWAHLARFVQLSVPFAISKAHLLYKSTLSKLRPSVLTEVQRSAVTAGGCVADHFSGQVGQVWQVVKLTCGECVRLASHNYEFPFSVAIQPKRFAALGVVPEIVDELPDPALLWQQAVANAELGPEHVAVSVDAPSTS